MDDMKMFYNVYQKIKFAENSSDCYSVADTKRKLLLLNYYGSIHSKQKNSVTEFLLNEDLQDYANVVDNRDPGQINNYAEHILATHSNYQNDDKKNWKTHLDDFNILEHVRKLSCSNDINCKHSNPYTPESLMKLKEAFSQGDDDDDDLDHDHDQKKPPDTDKSATNLQKNEAVFSIFQKSNIEKRNQSGYFGKHEVKKAEHNLPIKQTDGVSGISKSFRNPEDVKCDTFKNFNHKPEVPINQKSKSIQNGAFEQKTSKQFTTFKKNEIIYAQEVEEPERPSGFNAFRTARDELQIQNAKKFKKGENSAQGGNDKNNLTYGVVKKSLGTRKGGVFGKFQPPIRSKDNKNDMLQDPGTSMDVDEVVDERLKNIDPAMIELIRNEIMDCGSNITWDDIAGLQLAKSTIQEIVVWPMLRPDIFTGLRRPPKGILLFGPPGTGKTLIGKCIASQSNSTFFSISASSLTSKWVGDGEKMVRTLFAVAKVHQPSVVFLDEIDSLLSQRSDSEHECSRRIKTEFLVQLDGAGTGDEDRILIIGATNRPQELDEAARRRLVKRLYIPLPDEDARKQIIQNLISAERHSLTVAEIDEIAKLTKGYSGADVKNLCQEASLGPIRSIAPSMIQSINPSDVRPLNSSDFKSALCRIKSSVSESDLDVYVTWDKQYGCGSTSQVQ
ncbi:hypothetical protein RUM44_011090 [Polyplax serrata]|uniref:Fidgetin-like protein 1 n=1 Tax=Polyplax serrata TaxID=468196 RepID=A0ABR1AP35_POLSC